MKRFLLLALGTFFALPAAVGIFDAWCYVMLGRTVTGVQWNAYTLQIAALLLIPGITCAFLAGLVAEPERLPAGHNPPPTYARPPSPPTPPRKP